MKPPTTKISTFSGVLGSDVGDDNFAFGVDVIKGGGITNVVSSPWLVFRALVLVVCNRINNNSKFHLISLCTRVFSLEP